jgi:hypothetical protein
VAVDAEDSAVFEAEKVGGITVVAQVFGVGPGFAAVVRFALMEIGVAAVFRKVSFPRTRYAQTGTRWERRGLFPDTECAG